MCCFSLCGLDDSINDKFYDELLDVVSKLGEKEIAMIFEWTLVDLLMDTRVHGGFRYGGRNPEDERILAFGDATKMVVANTFLKKRHSNQATQAASFIMSW